MRYAVQYAVFYAGLFFSASCVSHTYQTQLQNIEKNLVRIDNTLKRHQEQLQNQEDVLMVMQNKNPFRSYAFAENLPTVKLPDTASPSQQNTVVINDSAVAKRNNDSTPNTSSSSIKAAHTQYNLGHWEEALALFQEIIRTTRNPATREEATYWTAACHTERKQWKDAVMAYARFTDEFPKSKKTPEALLQLGLAYKALSETEQAEQVFATLITAYPHTPASELARQHLSMHRR
jgi:TolA-binding protein